MDALGSGLTVVVDSNSTSEDGTDMRPTLLFDSATLGRREPHPRKISDVRNW
jgi:hypothetical protein